MIKKMGYSLLGIIMIVFYATGVALAEGAAPVPAESSPHTPTKAVSPTGSEAKSTPSQGNVVGFVSSLFGNEKPVLTQSPGTVKPGVENNETELAGSEKPGPYRVKEALIGGPNRATGKPGSSSEEPEPGQPKPVEDPGSEKSGPYTVQEALIGGPPRSDGKPGPDPTDSSLGAAKPVPAKPGTAKPGSVEQEKQPETTLPGLREALGLPKNSEDLESWNQ